MSGFTRIAANCYPPELFWRVFYWSDAKAHKAEC